MVTKAKKRGKAKRKILAESESRRKKRPVKVRVPKKKIPKKEKQEKRAAKESILFAVVRVRGSVDTTRGIKDTLKILRLNSVNHCIVLPGNPSYGGMLQKVNGYVTWGEISQQTLEKMLFKRGSVEGKRPGKEKADELAKKLMSAGKDDLKKENVKPVFRLSPPSKGYKSIRNAFPKGDLGYRGEKINELLKRMI